MAKDLNQMRPILCLEMRPTLTSLNLTTGELNLVYGHVIAKIQVILSLVNLLHANFVFYEYS